MIAPILTERTYPPGGEVGTEYHILHYSTNPTNETASAALVMLGLPDSTPVYKTCDGSYWIEKPKKG